MKRMIKNIFSIIVLLLVVSILKSCKPDECFHDTGNQTSLTIETGYFRQLDVRGIFEVTLVQDTTCYIEFIGGSKSLEYTQNDNTDSILSVDYSNTCFFLRNYDKIKLNVHFSDIKRINLYEACKVISANAIISQFIFTVQTPFAEIDIMINNESLLFYSNMTSAGVYIFRGNTGQCYLSGYYAAKIDARELSVKNAYINNSSIADFFVKAEESLHLEIHNKGNIVYYGSPLITIDSLTGSGRVISISDY